MVWPTWASAEQTKFLEGFLPELEEKKKGNGLNTFYASVAVKFLEKWKTAPGPKEFEAAGDNQELLQSLADARRKSVSSPVSS